MLLVKKFSTKFLLFQILSSITLKGRISRYQSMAGAGANERIANQIKASLVAGRKVKILAWKPDLELKLKGVAVDFVKGLENP